MPDHPVTAALSSLTAGLAAGIVADRFASTILLPITIVLTSAALVISARKRFGGRAVCLILCLAIGFVLGAARHHQTWWVITGADIRRHVDPRQPRLTEIDGLVLSRDDKTPANDQQRPTSRLIIRARSIRGDGFSRPCTGDILAETLTESLSGIEVGRSVAVSGWLENVPEALNPGEWSPRRYWRSRGVVAMVDLRSRGDIQPDPDGPVVAWRVYREKARHAAREIIREAVGEQRSGLIEALVLGIRGNVPQLSRDAFRDSGTFHLLAISGLHLQVVAMFVMIMARRSGLSLKAVAVVVVATSAFYAFMVTGGASVLRATVMAVTLATAVIRRRSGDFPHRMALAALVVLWLTPSDLFEPGAQLSFLGTIALFASSAAWQRISSGWRRTGAEHPLELFWTAGARLSRFEDRTALPAQALPSVFRTLSIAALITGEFLWSIAGSLFVSCSVWATTAALVAYHFGAINPVAVLANLPLVPITSFALMLGLGGLILGSAGLSWLALPLLAIAASAMDFCVDLLRFALEHGSAPWALATVGTISVVSHYGLASVCWSRVSGVLFGPMRRFVRVLPVAVLALCIHFETRQRQRPPDYPAVEMLAVDHGLAVLIRWPDGRNWLYDCGRMGLPEVGRNIVAPALRFRGVHRLDAVLVTHADADHYNGLESLLESGIAVDAIVAAPSFYRSVQPDTRRLIDRLKADGIPCRTALAGDFLASGPDGTVRLLFPDHAADTFTASDNAASLVVEIDSHGSRMILTGDLEGEGLRRFAENYAANRLPGDCSIFMAPHHGGLASNPPWLYEAIGPRLVVSSQGKNRFGSTSTLRSNIADYSPESRLMITSAEGALRFEWSPEGVLARGFLGNSPALHLPLRNSRAEPGLAGAAQVVLNP